MTGTTKNIEESQFHCYTATYYVSATPGWSNDGRRQGLESCDGELFIFF